MYLFYGIDNYLVNKAVAAFINKKKQNNYDYQIINFYLDSETAIKTFIDIWQLLQKSDIFDSEKIIIINDYFDFLYYHGADCVEFIQLLQTKIKNSTIIIKIFNNKITTLTAFFKTKKMIIFPVVSYTEEDLKTWFDQQIKKYQIKLKTQALMINKLPLQLTIIKNELKKWQFFQDEIFYSTILKSFEKYYDVAVSELF